jgi:hypothetical protein
MQKMMNDETKIRALMTYFHHWGNEQNRIRKSVLGAKETEEIIYRHFGGAYGIRHHNTNKEFWVSLSEALLEGMNHYTPYEPLYDLEMLYRRARFASELGVSFFNTHTASATTEQIFRIRALLALPPMA